MKNCVKLLHNKTFIHLRLLHLLLQVQEEEKVSLIGLHLGLKIFLAYIYIYKFLAQITPPNSKFPPLMGSLVLTKESVGYPFGLGCPKNQKA